MRYANKLSYVASCDNCCRRHDMGWRMLSGNVHFMKQCPVFNMKAICVHQIIERSVDERDCYMSIGTRFRLFFAIGTLWLNEGKVVSHMFILWAILVQQSRHVWEVSVTTSITMNSVYNAMWLGLFIKYLWLNGWHDSTKTGEIGWLVEIYYKSLKIDVAVMLSNDTAHSLPIWK